MNVFVKAQWDHRKATNLQRMYPEKELMFVTVHPFIESVAQKSVFSGQNRKWISPGNCYSSNSGTMYFCKFYRLPDATTLPVFLIFPFSQMPWATHRPGGKQLVGPNVADNPFLHWVPPELTSEYNRYVA